MMQEIFGPYQLTERIASGGMAEIFKARIFGQFGFEKTLAIKRLHPRYTQHPEFVEMLKQEAKIAVSLSHQNIVQIFDLGRIQEHFFIAMEYIHGRDVNQVFNRLRSQQERWPLEAVLHIGSQVCSGLDHAHRMRGPDGELLRLIHRDVTPQNVMISAEGDVKLVDFGIAKITGSQLETEAGMIKGKFCFMSPEQAMGARLDHRTDIFSAGIVLYELLTGRPMYDEEDDHRLIELVRGAHFTPLEQLRPDLPRPVVKLLNKALAHDPNARFPSARHFQYAIDKVAQRLNLTYTNLKLKQLITDTFPELSSRLQESYMQHSDDFDSEELSLISDYELSLAGEGDWEVPDITDEVEMIEVEELDPEELDPAELDGSISLSVAEERALSGEHISPYGTPPINPAELYSQADPRLASAPAAQAVRSAPEVAKFPAAAPTPADAQYYLADSEAQARGDLLGQQGGSGFELPDSTMILDEEAGRDEKVPISAPSKRRREPAPKGRSRPKPGLKLNELWAKQELRLAVGAVALLAIFGVSLSLRPSSMVSRPESAVIQLPDSPSASPSGAAPSGFNSQLTASNPSPQGQQAPTGLASDSNRVAFAPQQQVTGLQIGGVSQQRRPLERTAPLGQGVSINPVPSSGLAVQPSNASRPALTPTPAPVAPAPPSAPTAFVLTLESSPSGAEVAINDEWQPMPTPLSLQAYEGVPFSITLSLKGYQELRRQVVPNRLDPRLSFKLQEEKGLLVINCSPDGTEVSVNDQIVGRSPLRYEMPITSEPLSVKLYSPGFETQRIRLNWADSTQGTLTYDGELRLIPKPVVQAAPPRRASRPRPARRRSTRRRRAARPAAVALLSVRSQRWGSVYVDNKMIGDSMKVIKYKISAGRHQVKICFNDNRQNCETRAVTLSAEQHKVVRF